MRLLIYGMQSSGASLFAFLLSQEPETLAVVDCWGGIVPDFADYAGDIVLKTTVKTDVDFAQHVEAFKPDFTILVERNILEVRNSLTTKYYRDEGGTLEAKLRIGTHVRRKWNFDFVVNFADSRSAEAIRRGYRAPARLRSLIDKEPIGRRRTERGASQGAASATDDRQTSPDKY